MCLRSWSAWLVDLAGVMSRTARSTTALSTFALRMSAEGGVMAKGAEVIEWWSPDHILHYPAVVHDLDTHRVLRTRISGRTHQRVQASAWISSDDFSSGTGCRPPNTDCARSGHQFY
jgi:hypothetical protein